MVERNLEIKMPIIRHFSRTDTLELKIEIERKVGRQNAEKYFGILNKFLNLKLSKLEFNKLCIGTIGRENVSLHNRLVRAIIKNACLAETTPSKESKTNGSLNVKVANGYQRSTLQSICRDVFPKSPRKGRTPTVRDRKFRDRPSPLGPNGKIHNVDEDSVLKIQEHQSVTELLSLGSRPPGEGNSVEDGEEVDQAAGSLSIRSRSPVRAPLGIYINSKRIKKLLRSESAFHGDTCHSVGELPDASSLRNRLEKKLELDGFKVSEDFVYLMNNGLNVFLKRLITPCLELAGSRFGHKHPNQGGGPAIPGLNGTWPVRYINKPSGSVSASLLDFRVAMELNPQILGEEWPFQLGKICLHASE